MYAIYTIVDGSLYSTTAAGEQVAQEDVLEAGGLAAKECSDESYASNLWNPSTLAFDIPKSPEPFFVEPDEYLARFTPAEWAAARVSADATVQYLIARLQLRITPIDLRSPTIIQGVNYLETVGVIAIGRAAQVLTT